ncbi:MAG: TlpA disulfide reductase family protein [Bacteroidota bacterium]
MGTYSLIHSRFVLLLIGLLLGIFPLLGQTVSPDHASATPTRWVEDLPIFETFEEFSPLLSQANDTTYVVNFWATWCKPCVAELPYFEAFHAQAADQPVKVLLVSLDFPKQIETTLLSFVKRKELQSEVIVLLDGKYNQWIDQVSPDWSGAIPATLVFRNQSHIFREGSFESVEDLQNFVHSLP